MNENNNEIKTKTEDSEEKVADKAAETSQNSEAVEETNQVVEENNEVTKSESAAEKEKKSTFLDDVTDVIETIFICMLVFLMIRAYVFDQAIVDGTSMVPTLYNTEKVIYNKIYSPDDYDIVIVKNDILGPLVKRVVATEGEELDIRDGFVYVNGTRLDEQIYTEGEKLTAKHFISSPTSVSYNPFIEEEKYPITIPEGCIFVMGDNRCVSNDSRSKDVGFVSEDDVIGKVIMRYSPIKKLKFFW